MSAVDHFAEAERLLDSAEYRDWDCESPRLDRALAAAQVHATLAMSQPPKVRSSRRSHVPTLAEIEAESRRHEGAAVLGIRTRLHQVMSAQGRSPATEQVTWDEVAKAALAGLSDAGYKIVRVDS